MQIKDVSISFVNIIGKYFLYLCHMIGDIGIFSLHAFKGLLFKPYYFKQFYQSFINIGFYSLPVISLTAIFTGAVLALQSYTGFSRFNAESTIPTVVVLSITRELGPVLVGLMVSGRIASAIAAEIGTMRVTEQIDALKTLSTDPYRYLILPKIIAAMCALPLLVLIADILGVMGGYLVATLKLSFSGSAYLINTVEFLERSDVISGLYKSIIFGFIICLMGCYHGYKSQHRARGVGKATTYAVVSSSILILLSNYLLTELLFTS